MTELREQGSEVPGWADQGWEDAGSVAQGSEEREPAGPGLVAQATVVLGMAGWGWAALG